MTDRITRFRLEMLARLEEDDRALDKKAADIHAKKLKVQEQKARYSRPPPSDENLCLTCWFDHGVKSIMYPVPAKNPEKFDAWRCRECRTTDQRPNE